MDIVEAQPKKAKKIIDRYKKEAKKERAAEPKGPPLVNPTKEDAERLQAVWNAQAPNGTVVLLPGRTEYIEKYGRAAADLAQAQGHSISWLAEAPAAEGAVPRLLAALARSDLSIPEAVAKLLAEAGVTQKA